MTHSIRQSSIGITRDILKKACPIYFNGNKCELDETFRDALDQIRQEIIGLNIYTDLARVVTFLKKLQVKKAFIILFGSQPQEVLAEIHDLSAVDAIFIFASESMELEEWKNSWVKLHNIYTDIDNLCDDFQRAIESCNRTSMFTDTMAMESGHSDMSINEWKPQFIYSELMKNLLLEMTDDGQSRQTMIDFFREKMIDHPTGHAWMNEFERDYTPDTAIWWFTKDTFFKRIINQALEKCDFIALNKMAPFLRDLHRQLIHIQADYIRHNEIDRATVYHRRTVSNSEFQQLKRITHGFVSFHTFLSCYKQKEVTLASPDTGMKSVLFIIDVNLRNDSLPVANIAEMNYFFMNEVLFSPHAVFESDGMIINKGDQEESYELSMRFMGKYAYGGQLSELLDRFRKDIDGFTGQERMAQLFIKAAYFNQAEDIYRALLEQASNDGDIARYQYYLKYIRDQMDGYHEESSIYQENSENSIQQIVSDYARELNFCKGNLPSNHPDIAIIYDNIGRIYYTMKNYTKSLWYYRAALRIRQGSLLDHHLDLAKSYYSIGFIYDEIKEYSKALQFLELSLTIRRHSLPSSNRYIQETVELMDSVKQKIDPPPPHQ